MEMIECWCKDRARYGQAVRTIDGTSPGLSRTCANLGCWLLKHQATFSSIMVVGKQGKEGECGPNTGCLLAVKERDIGDHVSGLIHGQIQGSLRRTN